MGGLLLFEVVVEDKSTACHHNLQGFMKKSKGWRDVVVGECSFSWEVVRRVVVCVWGRVGGRRGRGVS